VEGRSRANRLVRFLEGTWMTTDITLTPNQEAKIDEYTEVMEIKDSETITITALGVDKGRDVTRDMVMRVVGDKVTLSQRDFSAEGLMKGNFVSLRGAYRDSVFDFRLYLLNDKYIYQKDVWKDNKITEVQMSYLVRSSK
jgi:hypothetical protein